MRKIICWTYALIKWLEMGITQLGINEVEAKKIKRRYMEDNTIGMVK